ncbi:MAG: hypothetical protein P8J50_04805 [Acidimicrobiales bacterium]|nr:hypothetical protein [Acidimicrobiales bacterium]
MAVPVVLVSNRGPLSFRDDGGELVADQAAALVEALDMTPDARASQAAELRRRAGARRPADWLADQLAAIGE